MKIRAMLNALSVAVGCAAAVVRPAMGQHQQPLRLVMNTELQVLDPVFTPSVVTRAFGYMV